MNTYLFGVHADRHLAVQVAFGDHVGTAGVHHLRQLQRLYKPPADRLVAVSPRHLLNTGQTSDGRSKNSQLRDLMK